MASSFAGGEQAVKEPCRSALGLLYEIYGASILDMTHLAPLCDLTGRERQVLVAMLKQRLNAPLTSSMGRLFDAVASLLDLCRRASFEGQAAMALEHAVTPSQATYAFCFADGVVDWEPMLRSLLDDLNQGHPVGEIAAGFHNTLADMIVALAHRSGEEKILLTGGCFQNRYLTEIAVDRLRKAGFSPYWHQQVPPNDGGIALGQVIAAAREYRR
jgi:hydrogenase maturation protein HypF